MARQSHRLIASRRGVINCGNPRLFLLIRPDMQCKCGSDAQTNDSVNKKLKATLEFYECKSCTRVSSAKLYIDGVLVAEDPLSRQHYAVLDKNLADRLLGEALDALAPPQPTAPIPLHHQAINEYETGNLF